MVQVPLMISDAGERNPLCPCIDAEAETQYLPAAVVDFSTINASVPIFKLQQNVKLIYQPPVSSPHSECAPQLKLCLFPKLLRAIPIPFLCSLNTNMTYHNSLYWKQGVAQTSQNCILYQHVHMLLSYYWKYNNLLTVSLPVWVIFMHATQTLFCSYYYMWRNSPNTRVIAYHRADCTFWFSIISKKGL